jgi:uncharacterized integral membrane protein
MSTDPAPHDKASGRSRSESARLLAIAILAVAATLFAVVNIEEVEVDLLFASVTMPLVVVIVGCLLLGGLIGTFLSRRRR